MAVGPVSVGVGANPVGGQGSESPTSLVRSSNPNSPFASIEQPGLSPEERAQAVRIAVSSGVRERIANAQSVAPSVRQQTQSEIINMALLYEQLGNPFSIRRIPFSVLRDMMTDPMIGMGLYYIKTPLVRADWSIQSPDAQLAAAVDEALRPIVPWYNKKVTGKLGYGYQPMVKQFKLGQLRSVYRDPHSSKPEDDIPTWPSKNVEPILWDIPLSLAPEHCLPRWNDRGEFDGFTFSVIPIPNPIQLGTAYIYGYQAVPGYPIPLEYAMWAVNEQEENYGSLYGSPRIKRAYRYYWSYWFRWALADRSFENKADPAKIVYYPSDDPTGLDPNDPNPNNPKEENVQQRAIALGQQARSGATLAIPGDFMTDEQGKRIPVREWELKYLEGGENFDLLDKTFQHLDLLKVRSLFIPESIFLGGRGNTAGGGTSTSRNVSTPIEAFDESQQLLADEGDYEINEMMIPQFIAANFPEKIGTPCRKVTRGFGQADTEIIKQLLQLVGQTKGYTLPVDVRELLRQANIPLLTQQQQELLETKIAKEAEKMQPPAMNPEKVGMQGYNAGVTKTPLGNIYVQPPQRILLEGSHDEFLSSLPDITPFEDQSVRSSALRVRKMFIKRYKDQIDSFGNHLKDHTPLQLALAQTNAPAPPEGASSPEQQQNIPPGLLPSAAAATAMAIVAAWFAQLPEDKTAELLGPIVTKIVGRAGERELHLANLDKGAFDKEATKTWVDEYVSNAISSVDSTIQKEMITFLTDELQKSLDPEVIVQATKEHFEEVPETHAERVARATTRDSYNYGMLSAGKDAGVEQVQAHDASDGDNPDTDPKCVERNGQVYTIEQALAEEEHPNGTLHWSYLTTENFSIELVDQFPDHLEVPDDMRAAFDDAKEILYVAADASPIERAQYALSIGSVLSLR